ncbi:MAG: exopolysaccharide biosynthesis protein [Lachnospiraceae bacterium]|nr:exopolysaccharide biosynthesis protein [Lachnospiraceae bacterium]
MFYLDMHCHILPGVDDGSRSMDMSMAMLDFAYEEGIRAIILTPHYHGGYVETERTVIDETFEELNKHSRKLHPDLKLFIGNEIYYYPSVPEWIEEGRVHTLADSDYVLLEFSTTVEKRELLEAVQNLCSHGYYPVLAHVERYDCLIRDPSYVGDLIDNGAYIQVNSKTIAGEGGMKIRHFVKRLLKEEWIHFIGTDAHSMGGRKPEIADCADYIIRKCSEEYAAGILYANAVNIIKNRPL